jgi:hypothetical protein
MDDRKTFIHRTPDLRENYAILPNSVANDRRLSYKARGLLFYLLTKPADWKCVITNLVTDHDRRTAVRTGLQELRRLGYVTLVVTRDEGQRHIRSYDYYVYASPCTNPNPENPTRKSS